MIKREEIHDEIDKALDKWGHGEVVESIWGSMTFQFVFERGKIVLTAKERTTSKEVK